MFSVSLSSWSLSSAISSSRVAWLALSLQVRRGTSLAGLSVYLAAAALRGGGATVVAVLIASSESSALAEVALKVVFGLSVYLHPVFRTGKGVSVAAVPLSSYVPSSSSVSIVSARLG